MGEGRKETHHYMSEEEGGGTLNQNQFLNVISAGRNSTVPDRTTR